MVGHTCVLHWPLGDATANILYHVMAFIYSVWEISCFTALIHGLWYSKYQRAQRWRRSACLHFQVTADWLKPDQWVVYWFDCVLKGYSHRVLGNLFLALGQDSRWWKQLPPFFFFQGLTLSHFSPLPCKLVQIKKIKWMNSIFKI